MIPLPLDELRDLGDLDGGGEATGLVIDSRLATPGDLFVAVRGGREFVAAARERGAATLVPRDEHAALAAIGRLVRSRTSARIVGVTGSTGKTSTKDILAALCSPVARTVANEASYNAELGVPLTLGRVETDTELCIVEMGMRGFGQIAELCEIARPDVGVITAIGPVHLELVGSVEGVARAKAELLASLPAGGIAVVPDTRLIEPHLRGDLDVRRVGEVDVELREDGAHVGFRGGRVRFPLTSRHQAQNALTALVVYEALGLPLDQLIGRPLSTLPISVSFAPKPYKAAESMCVYPSSSALSSTAAADSRSGGAPYACERHIPPNPIAEESKGPSFRVCILDVTSLALFSVSRSLCVL